MVLGYSFFFPVLRFRSSGFSPRPVSFILCPPPSSHRSLRFCRRTFILCFFLLSLFVFHFKYTFTPTVLLVYPLSKSPLTCSFFRLM